MLKLPENFESLEDAVSAFIAGCEGESDAQFYLSDVCALACTERNRVAWGMNDGEILKHLGSQAERSRSAMYSYLLVGRVFPKSWRESPENAWASRKSWSHHEVCARTWSPEDPGAPVAWLAYCVDNDLSVRQLKLEIKAAGGEGPGERPIYVLDAVPCLVDSFDAHQMTLFFDSTTLAPTGDVWPKPGDRVVVTVVLEPEVTVMPA